MGRLIGDGVKAVADDFMGKPIGPYSESIDGREIWGRPTTYGSSSDYIGSLTIDERFALLREAVDEGYVLSDDDVYMMGNSGDIHSFSDLVSRACSDLLRAGAEMIPDVLIRDGEQSRAFDAFMDSDT